MAPCSSGCLAVVRHTCEPHRYTGTHGAIQAGVHRSWEPGCDKCWKMIHPDKQLFLVSEQLLKLMIIVGLSLARPYCAMYRCILNSARVPGKLHDSDAEILQNPLSLLAVGGV